mgnify:CR=1 FL=1
MRPPMKKWALAVKVARAFYKALVYIVAEADMRGVLKEAADALLEFEQHVESDEECESP